MLALTPLGRGMSFHEFELVLGELDRHVVAGGYERELLIERPVHAEEMALARQLERVRPDLPPPFSRYWLDFALARARATGPPRPSIWPWTMETRLSPGATVDALGHHRDAADAPLPSSCLVPPPVSW